MAIMKPLSCLTPVIAAKSTSRTTVAAGLYRQSGQLFCSSLANNC